MKRISRELFGRFKKYVAVRPIKLSSAVTIQPGEDVKDYSPRLFQLQRWYRDRRIGVKDSAWAEAMLKDTRAHARPEVVVTEALAQAAQTENPSTNPETSETELTSADSEQVAAKEEAVSPPWAN